LGALVDLRERNLQVDNIRGFLDFQNKLLGLLSGLGVAFKNPTVFLTVTHLDSAFDQVQHGLVFYVFAQIEHTIAKGFCEDAVPLDEVVNDLPRLKMNHVGAFT
jgi:hypothetical protein